MSKKFKIPAAILLASLLISGCTKISADKAFLNVSEDVYKRTGNKISWETGGKEDKDVRKAVKKILSRRLTAKGAIQVALLNNRDLQATYTDLGVAQADLVQAGLLRNPILDAAITFPEGSNTPNLAFGLAFKFIEIFWIPLRKEVAASELETAKIRVSGKVINHASKTHLAYVDYVAAKQQVELLKQVARSIKASVGTAKALRKAGNYTALQLDQQKNVLTQARLELARAETLVAENREKLNVLMGLTGSETRWHTPKRLPFLPHRMASLKNIEAKAISKSQDLAEIRQSLTTLAVRYKLTKTQSLIPDLEVGGEFERDDGEKSRGATVELEIPIFDTGEAKRAKALMEINRLRNQYWALAIRIRSAARLLRARLQTEKKTVAYYRKTVLPESERLVNGNQRDYNAMQAGVFQLINAKRQQINVAQRYIDAQLSFWRAHISLQQLLSGRLPEDIGGGAMNVASAQAGGAEAGGH